MTGALFSFLASAVSIRELSKSLNVFEIMSIRSGLGLAVLVALVIARPELRHELALRHMGLHTLRNTTHFFGTFAWTLGVTLLPFATVFALEFTTPVWVALLAVPMLGEKLTRSRIGSIALGFLGVLVIVRPGLSGFQPMALLILFSAIGFALSLIYTKRLTNHVSTFSIVFWMNLMQLPMTLAWPLAVAATDGPPLFIVRLGADTLLHVITLGIVGLTSHYCLTNAFRSGDASMVVPMDFLRIPLVALIGWMFYAEALDIYVFVGAGLIVCGILWTLRAESRQTMRS
jgi:drug/metabolite transporter (DMT)-like permease